MSDYHILSSDPYGNTFQVVFHFPVPDLDNQAGVNFRTAVVEWLGGAPVVSRLPNVGAEQTQLDAGELHERVYPFNSNPNDNLAAKRAVLEAMYASKLSSVTAELQKVLSYWGYAGDVP